MTQEVCIVGGGAIGCATALELARAGFRVTLIEQGSLGCESSWSGAGLLSPLLPWDYTEEVTRLTNWGCALYPEWVSSLRAATGIDPEYIESGLLVLAPYDRDEALAWAAAHHQTLAEVSPRLVEPVLRQPGPALWLPQVAQIRNPRLMRALRAALQMSGVVICEGTAVSGLLVEQGMARGVSTQDGKVHRADQVVVAAGAWTPKVLGEAGSHLQIAPVRGQILLYKTAPGTLRRMIFAEGSYMIPRRDGHILVGSTLEDAGFDKSVTEAAYSLLKQRAEMILPMLKALEPVRQWAGLRPGSPNNIPTIGRHPQIANLWVSSGHFRYGVTMAPASARLLGEMLLGEVHSVDPTPYAWPMPLVA